MHSNLSIPANIDYGSFPQWLTLLVATVVGFFTVGGIRTARKSYKKSVRDSHVAQARLVYSLRGTQGCVAPGQPWPEFIGVTEDLIDPDSVVEYENGYGVPQRVLTETFTYVLVKVRNNSNEVISDVTLTLAEPSTGNLTAWSTTFPTVDPTTTEERTILFDDVGWQPGAPRYDTSVTFTDSGGAVWRRYNARPVEEVQPPIGSKA